MVHFRSREQIPFWLQPPFACPCRKFCRGKSLPQTASFLPRGAFTQGVCPTPFHPTPVWRERFVHLTKTYAPGSCSAYRCKASLTWSGGYQPLCNDPGICDSIQRSVQELLGEDWFVVEGEQAYASEDFPTFWIWCLAHRYFGR